MFKKKDVATVVYIQVAQFTDLGYLVETESQRKICEEIQKGKQTVTDSPPDMKVLFDNVLQHLKKNATVVGDTQDISQHSYNVMFVTRSNGKINMMCSLGWLQIETDNLGSKYLANLLEQSYSIDTTHDAIGG